VLIYTSFTLNFALLVNVEMTYIQSSFAIQFVLPYESKQHYMVY